MGKSNEASEKIYVHVRANKELGTTWHGTQIGAHDIEYVRTDAFIEKACEFLKKEVLDDYAGIVWEGLIEDFKNYMKGE